MPTIVHMVKRVTVSDNLTIAGRLPMQDITEYTYRDPVYEGRQREFRGFRHAAARRAGDANSPADVTETTFILGECVDETVGTRDNGADDCAASERWRDNPYEALKGLPIVTEQRNDTGVYLSTSTTKYRLRELYLGLDGRSVRHAFAAATETFLYDTAAFASSPSTTDKPIVEVSLRSENETTTPAFNHASEVLATDLARTHAVTQRASSGSATLRTASQVDYFGNQVRAENTGCAEGPACTGLGLAQETITTVTVPVRPAFDMTLWTWRTGITWVEGNQHAVSTAETFKLMDHAYDNRGTLLSTNASIAGTVNLNRDISDGFLHPGRVADIAGSLTGPVTVNVLTNTLDPTFGVVTRETGASFRCRDLVYDNEYKHLPVSETVYRDGCLTTEFTTTVETYDRGLELATRVVDIQGQPTDIRYDGFGRLTKLWKPHPDTVGEASALPSVEVEYFLPPTRGTAHSVIHTKTQDGATDSTNAYLESWSYVDGLGRTIASASEAESAPEARYIVSELTDVDNKGAVRRKYLDHFTTAVPDQLNLASEPAAPYGSQRYDAFGRQAQTFDLDGTVTLKSVYHALSKDMWDAADLEAGPHQGTFYTERTDGHGRVVETTERFKRDAILETRTTKIQYTPFGAPEVIRRIRGSTSTEVSRYMVYDRQGRMVLNVEPNVSPSYALVAQPNRQTANHNSTYNAVKGWRYAYNSAGDLVGTSDSRGCGVNYFTDSVGRLVFEDYFGCEPHHPLYSLPNPVNFDGIEAVYIYDVPVAAAHRDGDFHQQANFLLGRLVGTGDRAGIRVFDFDGRGRVTKETNQIQRTAFTHILSPTPRRYRRQYQYDAADRPVHETTGSTVSQLQGASAGGSTSAIQTNYNARGAVQSVGGSYSTLVSQIDRNADDLVSLIRYGDEAETESAFHYDDRRRLKSAQTYRSAPTAVWPPGWDTDPPETFQLLLQDDEYVYDVVNNPTEIHDYRIPDEWPAGAKPVTRRIDYDDLYRVTRAYYEHIGSIDTWTDPYANEVAAYTTNPSNPQAAIDRRRALPSPHISFTERMQWQALRYDWLGNTDQTTDSQAGFYDRSLGTVQNGTATAGPYRLTRASITTGTRKGELTTQYDDAGNLIRMDVDRDGTCLPSVLGCSQTFLYEWDELGRLTRARRYDFTNLDADFPPIITIFNVPAIDLKYRYDSSDQRVIKSALPASLAERHTVYIFPTLELRRAQYGTAFGSGGQADYERVKETEVPYLMANGVRLARVVYQEGLTVGVPGTLRVFLEMGDHLGSTSTVIDLATSEVVERSTYTVLGGPDSDYRPARWKSFREDYRFTGKEEDVEVGLMYFGKRYYAPGLGRWVSADPLGVHEVGEADLNLYAYLKGQALTGIDPLGLDGPHPVPFGLFGIAGTTEVERLANAFRMTNSLIGAKDESVSNRTDRVLRSSKAVFSPAHTGGWTRYSDAGFAKDLRAPLTAAQASSINQVGHFLTGVAHSRGEFPMGSSFVLGRNLTSRQDAMRLDIGHELAADPSFSWDPREMRAGFQRQYDAATAADVRVFERALSRMSSDPNGTINLGQLRKDLAPIIGKIDETNRGNSASDLMLTAVGWKFGDMVTAGKFGTRGQAAAWIERNLGEATTTGANDVPVEKSSPEK